MKTLHVFGNEFLKLDDFAGKVSKHLEGKANIIECSSPEIMLDSKDKEILILDVVKGIKNPVVIKDLSRIKTRRMTSMHDFDIGFFLNLMKNMGMNRKIKIIGIPQKGNALKTAKEVEKWL